MPQKKKPNRSCNLRRRNVLTHTTRTLCKLPFCVALPRRYSVTTVIIYSLLIEWLSRVNTFANCLAACYFAIITTAGQPRVIRSCLIATDNNKRTTKCRSNQWITKHNCRSSPSIAVGCSIDWLTRTGHNSMDIGLLGATEQWREMWRVMCRYRWRLSQLRTLVRSSSCEREREREC